MGLQLLDQLIIGAFLCLTLGVGLFFTRQASKNMENFFLGGRKLPWWLAGTSMVATTFSTDTPTDSQFVAVEPLLDQDVGACNPERPDRRQVMFDCHPSECLPPDN